MNKSKDIQLLCETCNASLGTTIKLGQLAEQLAGLGKSATEKVELDEKIRLGMCEKCKGELAEGCTFFVDKNQRCMKVSVKATQEKISKEYWGKCVMIPVEAMNQLIRVYAQDKLKSQE